MKYLGDGGLPGRQVAKKKVHKRDRYPIMKSKILKSNNVHALKSHTVPNIQKLP